MYCKHCETHVAEDAKFCKGCGRRIGDEGRNNFISGAIKTKSYTPYLLLILILIMAALVLTGIYMVSTESQTTGSESAMVADNAAAARSRSARQWCADCRCSWLSRYIRA